MAFEDCVQWDDHHNAPKADLILVFKDRVSFRVSFWYFKQKSDFIKGLLEIPSTTPIEKAPVHLDQNAGDVRTIIDLVYSSNIKFLLTAKQSHALLELCQFLQMSVLSDAIWVVATARLEDPKAFGLSPWECFKLGALRDDADLCRRAVLAFKEHRYDYHDICGQSEQFYADVPNRYLVALLVHNYTPYNGGFVQKDWPEIARKFVKLKNDDLDK